MTPTDELLRAIREACRYENGRAMITCMDAFKLAEKFDVTPARLGWACDQESIRICSCQLGCFE
jgi:hypothetical protein